MDLKGILLRKIGQRQVLCDHAYMWKLKKHKLRDTKGVKEVKGQKAQRSSSKIHKSCKLEHGNHS